MFKFRSFLFILIRKIIIINYFGGKPQNNNNLNEYFYKSNIPLLPRILEYPIFIPFLPYLSYKNGQQIGPIISIFYKNLFDIKLS